MAVATGFQGRTRDVQEPQTGVRRIDLPGTAADAVFADAKQPEAQGFSAA